jgi:hypothetical protein
MITFECKDGWKKIGQGFYEKLACQIYLAKNAHFACKTFD